MLNVLSVRMEIHPDIETFKKLSAQGNAIPVYLDLTADCETPLSAYSKIRRSGPAFLFESIVGGERISRYSFLGANPRKIFRIFDDHADIGLGILLHPNDFAGDILVQLLQARAGLGWMVLALVH